MPRKRPVKSQTPRDHEPQCDCLGCQTLDLAIQEVRAVEGLMARTIDEIIRAYHVPMGAMEFALVILACKSFMARKFSRTQAREMIDHVFCMVYGDPN